MRDTKPTKVCCSRDGKNVNIAREQKNCSQCESDKIKKRNSDYMKMMDKKKFGIS